MIVIFINLIIVCSGYYCVDEQSENNYLIQYTTDTCNAIDGVKYGVEYDVDDYGYDCIFLDGIGGNLTVDNAISSVYIGYFERTAIPQFVSFTILHSLNS